MKKKVLPIVLVAVLSMGILTGCGPSKAEAAQGDAIQANYVAVETNLAQRDTIFNSTTLSGKITANKDIMVVPKIPGRVEGVNVQIGDAVNIGSTLFNIEKIDYKDKLRQAQAGLDSSSAQLEQAQVGIVNAELSLESAQAGYNVAKANYDSNYEKIENAKTNFERIKKLYKEGIISKAEYEQAELGASDTSIVLLEAQLSQAKVGLRQAENASNQANASYKQAQAGYDNSKSSYDQVAQALNELTVTSPIKGIVSSVNIERGEMASNAQPAVTIVNMDKVYIKVDVTENLINKLHKGNEVKVYIPSVNEQVFKGKIYTVSPSANAQTQLYSVEIEINNEDHIIKPGMFARVEFDTDSRNDVIVVRSEAVTEEDGKEVVYVINDGKAEAKEVQTGLDTGGYVEIIDGIEEDDEIIIKGQNYVKNGSLVKVIKSEKINEEETGNIVENNVQDEVTDLEEKEAGGNE